MASVMGEGLMNVTVWSKGFDRCVSPPFFHLDNPNPSSPQRFLTANVHQFIFYGARRNEEGLRHDLLCEIAEQTSPNGSSDAEEY